MANGLAGQIDGYLKTKGSPLAGMGSVFVAAGKKHGVDPRLTVAISGAESSFGKHLFQPFNAWGWKSGDSYGSWPQSINVITEGLAKGYISQGLTTPATIVNKYNPADPGNRQHWANTVSTFMRELGASPVASAGKTVVKSPPTTTVPTGAQLVDAARTLKLPALPALPAFAPSTSGLQSALISNLGLIAQRGHASGSGMLTGVLQGAMQDRATDEANLAARADYAQQQADYQKALKAATSTATTPPKTTPTATGTSTPDPPHTQPPASSDTPEDIPPTKGTATVLSIARHALGTPYLWGGAGPTRFDCSGLLSYAYGQIGISLPHGSVAQYGMGQNVPKTALRPGDAVFFEWGNYDAGTGPGHVGIYIGNDRFIEAPHTGANVRISVLSDRGDYVGGRRYG